MLPTNLELVSVLQEDERGRVLRVRDLSAGGVERVYKRVTALDPRAAGQLAAEFEFANRLRHPNLARVEGFGRDGDAVWLLREYVPGVTLQQARETLNDGALHRIFVDVLRGLSHLHARGLLHLDVKPENVIIRAEDGRAVLTDFGLASRTGEAATRRGTPPFVAPEVLYGADADERSDLFSWGASLLLAQKGAPEVDHGELYLRFPRLPFPESVGIAIEDLPPMLAPFVSRMLSSDPADRPRSAASLLAEIGARDGVDDSLPEDLAGMLRPEGDLADPTVRASLEEAVLGEGDADAWLVIVSDPTTAEECVDRIRFLAANGGVPLRASPMEVSHPMEGDGSLLERRVSSTEEAAGIARATLCEPEPTGASAASEGLVGTRNRASRRAAPTSVRNPGRSPLLLAETVSGRSFSPAVAHAAARFLRDPEMRARAACRRLIAVMLGPIDEDCAAVFDRVVEVHGPDAARLSRHLAALEGSDPEAAMERLMDVSAALVEVHLRDPSDIADHLAHAVKSGAAGFRDGRLDLSRLTGASIRSFTAPSDGPLSEGAARLAVVIDALGPAATFARCVAILGDGVAETILGDDPRRFVVGKDGCVRQRRRAASHDVREALPADERGTIARRVLGVAGEELSPISRARLLLVGGDAEGCLAALAEGSIPTSGDLALRELLQIEDEAPPPELLARIAAIVAPRLAVSGRLDDAAARYEVVLAFRGSAGTERGEAALGLAEVFLLKGDAAKAEQLLRRARRLPADDEKARAFAVARGLAFVRLRTGDAEGAVRTLEAVLRSWKDEGSVHAAWLRILLGTFCIRLGRLGRARATLEDAVLHLRALPPSSLRDHLIPTALANLATLHLRSGRLAEALETLHAARSMRARTGRVLEEANVQNNLSIALRESGRTTEAMAAAREASQLFGLCGERLGEAASLSNLGEVLALRGEFDEARRALERSSEALTQLGASREAGLCRTRLALILCDHGWTGSAEDVLAGCEAVADARATASRELAVSACAAARGAESEALGAAKRAVAAARAGSDTPLEARGHLASAQRWGEVGDIKRSELALGEASRLATPLLGPEIMVQEGRIAVAHGAIEEAMALFLSARDEFRAQDRPLMRARAAANAARLLAQHDISRAAPLSREAHAALGAVTDGDAGHERGLFADREGDEPDRDVRLLGKELATAIVMPDPRTTTSQTGVPSLHDAVPLEMFRAVAAICRRLTRERNMENLLQVVVEHAVTLTGARRGFLVLLRGGEVVREVAHGGEAETDRVSRSIVMDAVRQRRPIVTANANSDGRFKGRRSIEELDLRSVLCTPFELDSGLAGALYVDNPLREGVFSPRSIDFLEVLADQAAVAISNFEHRREIELLRARSPDVAVVAGRSSDAASDVERWVEPVSPQIIGGSESFGALMKMLAKVASSEIPLLVLGESGTGKELVARAAHTQSDRASGPFVALNVSAVPESLIEAEVFGYKKGAFTGAVGDHDGFFVQAHGGTLFLDEIGDMPLSMQAKLLRAHQEGAVRPVGSLEAQRVDIRLICATHRDLTAAVLAGTFREDLYYRIRGAVLRIPPLRQREGDVKLLALHFLARWNREQGTTKELSSELLTECAEHDWPGNVRELESEIRRLVLMSDSDEVQGPVLREMGGPRRSRGDVLSRLLPLAEIEAEAYRMALEEANGNRNAAAQRLGVPRATFYARLKRIHANDSADGGE